MKSAKEMRMEASKSHSKAQFKHGIGVGLIAACIYGVAYQVYAIFSNDPFLIAGSAAFVVIGWIASERSEVS